MKNTKPYYIIIFFLGVLLCLLTVRYKTSHGYTNLSVFHRLLSDIYLPEEPSGGKNKKSEQETANLHQHGSREEATLTPAFFYNLGNASLTGIEGSMKYETELSINGLDTAQVAPLHTDMINVTGEFEAFRMLPKGTIFQNDIEVILPYDTALLPVGYTPYDIRTYYYNENSNRWIVIERDSVDVDRQLIISRVDHFTDFINAVIATPEMPETQAYVPTIMSDIKVADPLAGMTLVQPPAANNNGTANLTYPLIIPPGRQGMQPGLSVNYSSGGGNGQCHQLKIHIALL